MIVFYRSILIVIISFSFIKVSKAQSKNLSELIDDKKIYDRIVAISKLSAEVYKKEKLSHLISYEIYQKKPHIKSTFYIVPFDLIKVKYCNNLKVEKNIEQIKPLIWRLRYKWKDKEKLEENIYIDNKKIVNYDIHKFKNSSSLRKRAFIYQPFEKNRSHYDAEAVGEFFTPHYLIYNIKDESSVLYSMLSNKKSKVTLEEKNDLIFIKSVPTTDGKGSIKLDKDGNLDEKKGEKIILDSSSKGEAILQKINGITRIISIKTSIITRNITKNETYILETIVSCKYNSDNKNIIPDDAEYLKKENGKVSNKRTFKKIRSLNEEEKKVTYPLIPPGVEVNDKRFNIKYISGQEPKELIKSIKKNVDAEN